MNKCTMYNVQCTIEEKSTKQAGYTLIEVLISILIASVVGGLLLVVIVNSTGLFYKQSSKVEAGLNINDSLSSVRNNIKDASAVAESFTKGSETYTTNQNQLVLKVPSVDSANNIISNTYDYFVLFQDLNKLRYKVFVDAASNRKNQDQIFSTSVDSLVVEVIPGNATKVRVTVILKQKVGTGYETNIATTEANLRND